MTQRVGLLNGENLTFDSDISTPTLAILNQGVIQGLEVKDSLVTKGKALIKVKRDNSQEIMVNFELTQDLEIDTSGTKSVYIEINSKAINDGSLNSEDGTGIGEIKIGAEVPLWNYIKLANISNNIIEDKREFIGLKDKFNLTKMGNSFNKANELLKLDENGKLPVLSGERLINIKSETKGITSEFIAGESAEIEGKIAVCEIDGKIFIADKNTLGKKDVIGFISESLVSGEKCKVTYGGSVNGFTELKIGTEYFLGIEGKIEENGKIEDLIGYAITDEELKLDKKVTNDVSKDSQFPIGSKKGTVTHSKYYGLAQAFNLNKKIKKVSVKFEGYKDSIDNYDGNTSISIYKKNGNPYNDMNSNEKVGLLQMNGDDLAKYKAGDYIDIALTKEVEGEYRIYFYDNTNRILYNSDDKQSGQTVMYINGSTPYNYEGGYIHLKIEYNSWGEKLYGETANNSKEGTITLGKAEGFLTVKINGEDKKIPYYPN